jgi:hypothetical protein
VESLLILGIGPNVQPSIGWTQAYFTKVIIYKCRKFYCTGAGYLVCKTKIDFFSFSTKDKSYKTFNGRNLQMFVPGRPFQPSVMFLGKARSLP